MSEAFQKLHEVLVEIADVEKIEITKIEVEKDLSEIMSSCQSLVIFSNAKNCALFLQENKSLVAKFHTKVILFVPKEIPGKMLAKFLKLGLTEAILEGSPPKTLLHKVKKHINSIKSDYFKNNEDKDQVVTSTLNQNRITDAINDLSSAKQKLEKLQNESLAKKNSKEGTGADNKEGLKKNNNLKTDAVGTSWNPKRKMNNSSFTDDNRATGFKNKREKNVYYPTKKKIDTSLKAISEYINKKNNFVRKSKNLTLQNTKAETSLDLNDDKKKREKASGGDNLDSTTPPIETMDYGLGNKYAKKEFNPSEGSSESTDLDQEEKEISSGDIKNKLNKNSEDTEIDLNNNLNKSKINPEAENKKNKPDEEAGYCIEKKSESLFQRNGEAEELLPKDDQNNDEEAETKKNKFNKNSVGEMPFHEDALDALSPLVIEDIENDHKAKEIPGNEEEDSNKKRSPEDSSANFGKGKKAYKIVDDNESDSKRKDNEDDENFYGRETKDDIFIDMSGNNPEKEFNVNDSDLGDNGSNLLDQDDQGPTDSNNSSKNKNGSDNDADMSFNKINQDNLEQGKNTNDNSNRGKGNDLNASLQNDDPQKSGYSWDNLVDKNKSTAFDVVRDYHPQVDLNFSYLGKIYSEQTIDYRKIKKEFDKKTPIEELEVYRNPSEEIEIEVALPDGENLKKVIELDVRGIEFSIEIVKLIYNKDTVDIDYFNTISKELISQYKGYAVFYTYETSSNEHLETFNTFTYHNDSRVPEDLKKFWAISKDDSLFGDYFTKSMPTWQCRDIQDKSKEGKFWEDIELPSWASTEMTGKKMELVFPYFDGVDLMGTAIIFFPEGLNVSREKSIIITLDTARTVLLNTIKRKNESVIDTTQGKSIIDKIKKILNLLHGFFKRNKKDVKEEIL